MKFNVNRKGKAKCPSCGSWVYLEIDRMGGPYHEFECCGRVYLMPLDFENLEKIKKGETPETPPAGWWIRNQ